MTSPTTDLAARFEAKREECEAKARAAWKRGGTRTADCWLDRATAFAEARDMARAGAAGGAGDLSAAAADVLAERRRQVDAEGWAPKHDDAHRRGEMATAAACYAKHAAAPPSIRHQLGAGFPPSLWPWDDAWWKPIEGDRRRDLVKAGALILAEIERLDRACAAAPPPPAQQGSSSPPLTAERVDLGELERLSAAATQGKWSVGKEAGGDHYLNATGSRAADPCGPGMPWDGFAAFVVEMDDEPFPTGPANAAFVVALVNAYRSGHLAPASLPAGTGSAEEGTDLGAPASPTGLLPDSHVPTGHAGFAAAIPSRGPWDSGVYDFASSVAAKVAALTWAWADTTDAMNDRYADVQGIVDTELRSLTDDMTAGEIYRTPAPCDGSGKAGETEGLDPKGDSAMTEGQAPQPDPVREAKALLEGLDPHELAENYDYRIDGEYHITDFERGMLEDFATGILEKVSAALATLHASQDQAGEVRE